MQGQTKSPKDTLTSPLTILCFLVFGVLLFLGSFVWAAARIVAFVRGKPTELSLMDSVVLVLAWAGNIVGGGDQATEGGKTLAATVDKPLPALPAPTPVIAILAVLLFCLVVFLALWVHTKALDVKAGAHGGWFRTKSAREQEAARWATRRDLRGILARRGQTAGKLVLGRYPGMSRKVLLAVEQLHSVFVLGPTQSYKTSGLAIPALLEWEGCAVVTSVKTDLLRATKRARWRRGEVLVFDPAGFLGDEGATWNPLEGVTSWSAARELAKWLMEAAAEHKELGDATKGFFERRGQRPLAAALWAASLKGYSIGQVRRWLDELGSEGEEMDGPGPRRTAKYSDAGQAILDILAANDALDAMISLKSVLDETERQRSGSITSAQDALEVFGDDNVERACSPGVLSGGKIDPDRVLDGPNTLYLYAPLHEQDRLRPVFEALIMSVVRTAMERSARTGEPLSDRLLVLLDEAGNVAPLRALAQLASTAAGQGIQLLTIFQDFSQVRHRYGQQAATVVNNHRAKVLLSGLSDPDSLEYVSRLIGDSAEVERSVSVGEDRRSTTDHVAYRRLAPMAALRQTKPGEGVLVYGHLPPVRLRLRWWKKDKELARLAGEPDEGREVPVGDRTGGEVRGDGRVVQLAHHRRRRRAS